MSNVVVTEILNEHETVDVTYVDADAWRILPASRFLVITRRGEEIALYPHGTYSRVVKSGNKADLLHLFESTIGYYLSRDGSGATAPEGAQRLASRIAVELLMHVPNESDGR